LFFPAGEYRNNTVELTVPNTCAMSMLGAGGAGDGAAATLIRNVTDLGLGKYGLTIDGTNKAVQIERMVWCGPRAASGAHTFPANMNGIKVTGEFRLVNSTVLGFRSGIALVNPHVAIAGSYVYENGYGIYYLAGSTDKGELLLDRVALDAQAIAGIAIDPAATASNVTVLQCHFGQGSAYCFYRPGTPGTPSANPVMLEHLVVFRASFESPSNGMLYDEPGDGIIQDLTFKGCPEANLMGATNYPTIAREAGWKCDTIRDFYCDSLMPLQTTLYPAFKAKTIENIGFYDPLFYFSDQATYATKKFKVVAGGDGLSGVQVGDLRNGALLGGAMVASGAIAQWDVIQMDGARTVKTHTGNVTDRAIGVALHATASGDVCHYWSQGRFSNCQLKVASGNTVVTWRPVKVDTANPGYVKEATSMADPNVIGMCTTSGVTGPGTIDARLSIT
jgi:hypothetical protein